MLLELVQRSVGLELVRFKRLGCETSKLSSQTLLAASLKSILAAGNMQAMWGKGLVGTKLERVFMRVFDAKVKSFILCLFGALRSIYRASRSAISILVDPTI